ncbi:tigger transposable element-derived protein 1-like [Centruroides vittatus]|uniref:tigger transposable element-derived protein 1-like n=1 Tax=Centruroides vittatus TaxID=120091 RepID=UPI0035100F2F
MYSKTLLNAVSVLRGSIGITRDCTQCWDQGIISNFKAYYLRQTFRQLIDKTDGADNNPLEIFGKTSNIMDAVDNINLSWNEVTEKCFERSMEECMAGAKQGWLDNINAQDIEELLQVTTGESFSDDDLKELVEQQVHEDDEISVSEDEEQKELSTDFLKKSLASITEIMDQFIQNDFNFDRSSKARRSVMDAMSCYRQLLAERNRKRQTTLDDFFTKKQKMSNEEEPSSSQT